MTDKEKQVIKDLDFPCKEKITVNGIPYHISVLYDDSPENPRDLDNLGTITYSHSRYVLGDHSINDQYISAEDAFYLDLAIYQDVFPPEKLHASIVNIYEQDVEGSLYTEEETRKKMIEFVKENYIILPVYLYDHSGLIMNTKGFVCPWDSGQVGFIYVDKNKIKKEFEWKNLSPKRKSIVEDMLRGEVEAFNHYINGEIYTCSIEDDNGNNIETCCGGFYTFKEVHEFIFEILGDK